MSTKMELTCPRCERTRRVTRNPRTFNASNALYNVPLATEEPDTPACSVCVVDLRERRAVDIPESRGWEDEIVRYETGFGWLAEAVVLREDEPDPRGNLLGFYIGPAPQSEQPVDLDDVTVIDPVEAVDAGEDLVTLRYESCELVGGVSAGRMDDILGAARAL